MPLNLQRIGLFLGLLFAGAGFFMLLAVPWAVFFREWDALAALIESAAAAAALGALLMVLGRRAPDEFFLRDAIALVAFGWTAVSVLGALPFILSGQLGVVDAIFESVSGYTTTGSSVMSELDSAPRSIVFWRCLTQWLGGMGIVLMLVAVLPYLGTGGKMLVRRESSGPDPKGIRPRVRDTARDLYVIYIGWTAAGTAALMLAGMSFYEALCHCFTALSTGGYSTRYDSISAFNSPAIEAVLIVIMLAGAVNFALYFGLLRGRAGEFLRDAEIRMLLAIFLAATAMVTVNLAGMRHDIPAVREVEESAASLLAPGAAGPGYLQPRTEYPWPEAFRKAVFQVATLMTDTGFVTANTDTWPYLARVILIIITITGGCAGSTSGGLKMIRVIILAKMTYWWVERAFRPKRIRAIRINGEAIDDDVQRRVFAFFTLYIVWLTFAVAVLSAFGLPLDSAIGGAVATLNNCGPGFEFLGSVLDFALLPPACKLFLCLNMLVGRLEIVTVLALFLPAFWTRD